MSNNDESTEHEKSEKPDYNFKADTTLKNFFKTALSSEQVIAIANEVLEVKVPTGYNVTFGDTESADVTGSTEKDFVVGDKLVIFSHPDVEEDDINKFISDTTLIVKLILEFQNKKYYDKHYTMGLRLFCYTINSVERTKVGREYVFDVPDAITIYTDRYLPKYGTDDLIFKFPSFWGANTKFYGHESEFFKLEYKYVNLLAFAKDDFKDTAFDLLEVLYLYKYRKNIDLMLGEDYKIVLRDIAYKITQNNGKILELLAKMYQDLIYDISLKANTNTIKYERLIEDMVEVQKSYGTKIIDDAKAEAKAENKLTLALEFLENNSGLLENNSVEFVSKLLKLPIEYVQALEDGCTVESIIEEHFEF